MARNPMNRHIGCGKRITGKGNPRGQIEYQPQCDMYGHPRILTPGQGGAVGAPQAWIASSWAAAAQTREAGTGAPWPCTPGLGCSYPRTGDPGSRGPHGTPPGLWLVFWGAHTWHTRKAKGRPVRTYCGPMLVCASLSLVCLFIGFRATEPPPLSRSPCRAP